MKRLIIASYELILPIAENPSLRSPLVSRPMESKIPLPVTVRYFSNVALSCGKLRVQSTILKTDSSVPRTFSPACYYTNMLLQLILCNAALNSNYFMCNYLRKTLTSCLTTLDDAIFASMLYPNQHYNNNHRKKWDFKLRSEGVEPISTQLQLPELRSRDWKCYISKSGLSSCTVVN